MQPAQLDDHLRKTGDHLRALATLDKPSRVLWRAYSKTIDYLEYEPSPIIRVRSMAINDHDIDAFLAGSRGLLIERILGEEGVRRDEGVFYLHTSIERLSEALSCYGRALTRIYELTHYSRSRAAAAFSSLASSEGAPKA